MRALYDGAVTAIDDAVGRILEDLEKKGLADRTIVVVTSPHGEALYDHGRGQGQGDVLFGDEGTHVPLIVFDPRVRKGNVERRIVRDVDLAPTLYELANVPPPSDIDGRSFAPSLRGESIEDRFAYAETEPPPGSGLDPVTLIARHRMVRDDRFKLVYVPTRQGVKYSLFDLREDPGETRDVAAEHPEEVKRLRVELWAWMLQDPRMEQKDGFLAPKTTPQLPYNVLFIVVDTLRPVAPGKRGVRFTHAYASGSSRPGVLAMLSGARPSELDASEQPLLPLLLGKRNAVVHASANTNDATRFLRDSRDARFFLFVNYDSHAKSDEAVGAVLQTLDETGLRDRTIVVVTADHGETRSRAHATSGNYEETTRIPIFIAAPGLPEDREVEERVRSVDIAPTILELLGVDAHPRMSGMSLARLARGQKEADERVVLTEGRGTRAILHGRYRLLVREGRMKTTSEELYDLVDDPGERHNLATAKRDVVAEMRARLVLSSTVGSEAWNSRDLKSRPH